MENLYFNELYFDMDEVIVNLSEYVISIYNRENNDNFNYKDNKSYWWLDAPKGNKEYFKQVLNRPGTFINTKPNKNAIETLNKLKEKGYEINIVTMPQWNQYCCIEKIKWIKKYLSWFDFNNLFFTSNKGKLAKSNRILIDDNAQHLVSWKNNNGMSIAFGNFNWNKDLKDYIHVYDFKELEHTLLTIENSVKESFNIIRGEI